MEFSRPEYWSGLPFPPPGNLPHPGVEPRSPALQADSLTLSQEGSPSGYKINIKNKLFFYLSAMNYWMLKMLKIPLTAIIYMGKES